VAVASAGPYASLFAPDRQPHLHPTTLFFTGRMPFLPPNQQRQSTILFCFQWICIHRPRKKHNTQILGFILIWLFFYGWPISSRVYFARSVACIIFPLILGSVFSDCVVFYGDCKQCSASSCNSHSGFSLCVCIMSVRLCVCVCLGRLL